MQTPTYWTVDNAAGAKVFDVDAKQELGDVMSVDTAKGEVVRACRPLRVEGEQIATFTQRFRSIYPIFSSGRRPELFHCYGLAA